jgi:hypothetical protein
MGKAVKAVYDAKNKLFRLEEPLEGVADRQIVRVQVTFADERDPSAKSDDNHSAKQLPEK